jgi:phosphoglycerate dehydrogenase-like enzyme
MKIALYSEHWNRFWCLPPEMVEWIRTDFPQLEFIHARTEEAIGEAVQEAEIYFGYRLPKEALVGAKRLKWIHVPAASIQPLAELGLLERNITVTNSRGLHAGPISEHVIGCMLVFARKFIECWEYQLDHRYAAREILTEGSAIGELRGKTVVILGLGSIGTEIARLAKAFNMRVVGVKKNTDDRPEMVDQIFPASDFRQTLPEADYLVIAVPHTAATEGMIGETELKSLKKTCVLINIARGGIIEKDALMRSLKEHWFRGAALDVFHSEPVPPNSELYDLPNVFMTPHTSGVSALEHWPRMMELFAENLRRYVANQPLMNVVDLREGY